MKNTPSQAIILAAGLGTRLLPLTKLAPKPALPLGGVPILWFNLLLLKHAGVRHVVVNLYHLPQALKKILPPALSQYLGIKIEFSIEKKILGTAGGIAQALNKLNLEQECWILNGDILSDINLSSMAIKHAASEAMATLAVISPKQMQVKNHLYYDRQLRLCHIGQKPKFKNPIKKRFPKLKKGVFSGLHLIKPKLFASYPKNQFGCVIQNVYQKELQHWLSQNTPQRAPLQVFEHQGSWWDVGKLKTLTQVDQMLWQEAAPKNILTLWKEAQSLSKLYFS